MIRKVLTYPHWLRDRFDVILRKFKEIAFVGYKIPPLMTKTNPIKIFKNLMKYGVATTYDIIRLKLLFNVTDINETNKILPVVKNINVFAGKVIQNHGVIISVIIPVKNGGDDFRNLLRLLKNQKGFDDIEILVVDSGSTDRSIEISREFEAKILQIPPEEFSHSYARNLGAESASGDYLLFTVQDALPPSEVWLYELYSVLKGNDVVAVSCTELPRADSDLFYNANSWLHDCFMGVSDQDRILTKPDKKNYYTLRKNSNLSNIACLIDRGIFMKYGFKGNYAEDLNLGLRLISDGYKLALLSSTRIIHSHNRQAHYFLKRGYVDHLHLSKMFPDFSSSAVEAQQLFHAILFTYQVINSIVSEELPRYTMPCKVTRFFRIVMKTFRTSAKKKYPLNNIIANNIYIDNGFKSFIEHVNNSHYHDRNCKPSFYNIFLDEMLYRTKLIMDYMEDTFEIVDDNVLEEFKSSLYKIFASICGYRLSVAYSQGSKGSKKQLLEFNNKLIVGI